MRPHSLRLRLILVSALAIIVALTAASLVLTTLFADHVGRVTVRNLTAELNRLAAVIDADRPEIALSQPMSDPRFDVPYGGIYWQVRDPATGEVLRSRSMWDKSFETDALAHATSAAVELRLTDPEGTPAVGIGRLLSFELEDGGVRPLELIVAEDNEGSEAAIAAYRLDLVKALAVLGVILVAAAWAQVTLGLSPLRAVRRGVAAIRAGEATTLAGDFPSEVQPLVAEVNELTQAQETAIQFARARASDLAHGLKGRLQVLNAEAHELRLKGETAAAATIEGLTQDMADIVDHQLRLTRLRRRTAMGSASSDLGAAVAKIVRTVRKTSRGAELAWDVEVAERTAVALDGPDLAELLGALIENAAKWSAGKVAIRGEATAGGTRLCVEDDGPGMTDAQIGRLGERGVRLDESRSGSGLGISIAREIVALNGGTLEFTRSAMGGLAVTVSLPASLARA